MATPDDSRLELEKGDVTGYRVVVSLARAAEESPDLNPPEADRRILQVVDEAWALIGADLTSEAQRALGPAFSVRIEKSAPTGSVELFVVIYAAYKVIADFEMTVDNLRKFAGTLQTLTRLLIGRGVAFPVDVKAFWDESAFVGPTPAPIGSPAGAWQQVGPVLGAIATGVGVLGFVTFAGGAIEFARLEAAGLPAEEGVAAIPTANLIVIGARALAPAVLAALGATVAFYVWHFIAVRQPRVPDVLTPTVVEDTKGGTGKTLAPPPLPATAFGLVVVVLIAQVVGFFITESGLGSAQVKVVVLVGLATLVMCAVVASRTQRTLLHAVAAALSVASFVGFLAYAKERDEYKVRGAAVVRENKKAVTGFFIAESSDRVYLARRIVDAEPRGKKDVNVRLIAFAKDQVTDVAIGPLTNPDNAYRQAVRLAEELCLVQVPEGDRGETSNMGAANKPAPQSTTAEAKPTCIH